MAPLVQQLRWQLQELAQPADVQIAIEGRGYADELALDFDNWYPAALDNHGFDWTERQKSLLARIDSLLDAMSGPENAELWTDEALRTHPDWERARHLAKEALKAFGWSLECPPRHPRAAR